MPRPDGNDWFDTQQRDRNKFMSTAMETARKRKQDEDAANATAATQTQRNEFDKAEFARNMGVTATANAARQAAIGAARDVEATVQEATTQEGGGVAVDEGAGGSGSDNRRRKARASGQTGVNI